MTRVVVDTNVLVSALLSERGAPSTVLALIVEGQLIWCLSEVMVAEYASVLSRPKFQHIQRSKIAAALALAKAGEMTITTTSVTSSSDESDNRFLECAEALPRDRKHAPFPQEVESNQHRHSSAAYSSLEEIVNAS
jgi:hypothetical protein